MMVNDNWVDSVSMFRPGRDIAANTLGVDN